MVSITELFDIVVALWVGQTVINLILAMNLDSLNNKIEKLQEQLKEK